MANGKEKETEVTDGLTVAEIKKMNLYQRLNLVSTDLQPMGKDKTNEHHRYDYTSERAVKKVFKPLFEKYRIDFSFSIENQLPVEGIQLGKMMMFNVGGFVYFTNIDDPADTLAYKWICQGADSGDKAFLKAETSGIRHWLLNKFLIETGVDIEDDAKVDKNEPTEFIKDQEVLALVGLFPSDKQPAITTWIPSYQGSKKALVALLNDKLKLMKG